MLIPKNGKVIIIDDKENQSLPLLKALGSNNIPCSMHSEKSEELPSSPYKDVRILFLDINLTASTSEKDIKGVLITTLKKIISPGSVYILAIWSVKEDLVETVMPIFDSELKDIKPILHVLLQKADFFDYNPDTSEYSPKNSTTLITDIQKRIEQKLAEIDGLELIIRWEEIINEASSKVISEVISLASTGDLNKKLKGIYFKLAEAYWGKQLKKGDDNLIATKAASVFNQLLVDKIELGIFKMPELTHLKNLAPPDSFNDSDRSVLNSKLLLTSAETNDVLPGNVYLYTDKDVTSKYPFNPLIADLLNVPQVAKEFYYNVNGKDTEDINAIRDLKNEKKKDYEVFEKGIRDKIRDTSIYIAVELSPICDFAQKKWKSNRLCPGLLWSFETSKYLSRAESLYASPPLDRDGKSYVLSLDFRYFTSWSLEELKGTKPGLRLKPSLLVDIQSAMSNHISRPGIMSL